MPKSKKSIRQMPRDSKEVADAIGRFAELKQQIVNHVNRANARINRVNIALASVVGPLESELAEVQEGIYLFSQLHRETLTEGGNRKSVEFATGTLLWRRTKPRMEIRGWDRMLSWLRQHKLDRFIRIKEEPRKEAMLAEPEVVATIPGAKIVQDEIFYIKPDQFDTEVEIGKKRVSAYAEKPA